jgi:flagellar basal body-associated protein FliL
MEIRQAVGCASVKTPTLSGARRVGRSPWEAISPGKSRFGAHGTGRASDGAMSQAPAAAPAKADAPSGGKANKLVLGLVVFNVLAIAGIGGYLFWQSKHPAGPAPAGGAAHGGGHGEEAKDEDEAHADGEEEHAEEGEEDEEGEEEGEGGSRTRGPILSLDSQIMNFVDAEETHFLKVTVQLEAKNEAAKAKIEEALVPIKSLVLMRLSSLTIADTVGAEKKRALLEELRTLINRELGGRRVKKVYFTEFVVQ